MGPGLISFHVVLENGMREKVELVVGIRLVWEKWDT